MEKIQQSGKARSIGLSNFNIQHLRQVLSTCTVRPTTLQVELHPHNPQDALLRFCKEAGIQVTAFSPLGGINPCYSDPALMNSPVITGIAAKHQKSPAQVLLRWAVQRGTLPISKSNSPTRMRENRALFDFYLSKEDLESLATLNIGRRYNDPGAFCEAAFGTFCPIHG